MIDVWSELPPEFRLPDPEAIVRVWRGDSLGKLATGMSCRLAGANPEHAVLDVARRGHAALINLVDEHTSAHQDSPLVSVTADIRLAQCYAGVRKENETIYELHLPGHRLLRDPANIGTPLWPIDSELFVIGAILPSDIIRVKTNNSAPEANELVYWEHGRRYLANALTDMRTAPAPDLPNPRGVWVEHAKQVA